MKRIITCSDGTWNKITSDANTNVVKMYNSICKEGVDEKGERVVQLKAYDEADSLPAASQNPCAFRPSSSMS